MNIRDRLRRWLMYNLLYFGRPAWDTGVSPPELVHLLDDIRPGRALDVGCGTGTNLLAMAEKDWEVTGLDFAWLPVLKARRKLHAAGFEAPVFRWDVTKNISLGDPFDLVLDGRRRYRENLDHWLTPGGYYLLYAHGRRSSQPNFGVDEADLGAFQSYLQLSWRSDNDEVRPDGSGGFPALWARFKKPI